MNLLTKPDFAEARKRWQAFWHHEIIKRPCVCITASVDECNLPYPDQTDYMDEDTGNPAAEAEIACMRAEDTYWGGDAIPWYAPGFGPDQFAAFLGVKLKRSPHSGDTSWAMPVIDSWEDTPPLRLDPNNPTWRKMLEAVATCARIGEGRFLVSMPDLASNLDALSALRGPQRLMSDLIDVPETIEEAMRKVRAAYRSVYEGIYEAGNMKNWGTTSWLTLYSKGKYNVLQADVIYMISSEHFRRFVLPALEEESAFLDHSFFHLDGIGALTHLDDILAIEGLDGIQWNPGAGQPPSPEWIELYKKIQAAGKHVYLDGTMEEVKHYHRELRPELVVYWTYADTAKEANEFLKWMEDHT